MVRIGTSSFSSPDWVGVFYRPGTATKDFLKYYSSEFDTVELDTTYYSIPSKSTVKNWFDTTPDNFLFSAKFPRRIVHGGKGAEPDAQIILDSDSAIKDKDRFLETIGHLESKLGVLLLQFPYFSQKIFPDPDLIFERLEKFIENLPRQFKYAIEIRNPKWMNSKFARLCAKFAVTPVMVDHSWMPHGDQLDDEFHVNDSGINYIRLLGDRKKIEALTSTWDKEVIDRSDNLRRWAKLLEKMTARGQTSFVYINNHYAGHAPATARRLKQLCQEIISGGNEND